jgi:hypothetical protein
MRVSETTLFSSLLRSFESLLTKARENENILMINQKGREYDDGELNVGMYNKC